MLVVTKKDLIASAAERYRAANQYRDRWLPAANGASAAAVYSELKDLTQDASEDQVTAVTGDNRWTQNICDECGNDAQITVALGMEAHHATDAAFICSSCLEKAISLVRSAARYTF